MEQHKRADCLWAPVALLIVALMSSGCDKHKALEAELFTVDANRKNIMGEIDALDKKFHTMGSGGTYGGAYNTLQSAEQIQKHNDEVEFQAASKLEHWTKLESTFAPLKAQCEAYKAKYLR